MPHLPPEVWNLRAQERYETGPPKPQDRGADQWYKTRPSPSPPQTPPVFFTLPEARQSNGLTSREGRATEPPERTNQLRSHKGMTSPPRSKENACGLSFRNRTTPAKDLGGLKARALSFLL